MRERHGQREQHRDDQVGEGQDESAANLRGLSLDRRYVASVARRPAAPRTGSPTPRTVAMYRGSDGSSSIFLRSHEMWTSSVFVGPNQCGSQTSSMIASRRTTSPAFAINMCEQVELLRGELDALAVLRDRPRGGSSRSGPISIGPAARGGAASPHDRAHARDQLAGRERLDHVVVGAELEADDPIDLLAARGEHDDRDVGLGPDHRGRGRARRRRGA